MVENKTFELIYCWIEDYKNIDKQGFSFSPRFECNFYDEYEKDENGREQLKDNCKLEIKPKKHIENFFGDNINVTAIVGKNGCGKSSLLEQLFYNEALTQNQDTHFFIINLNNKLNLFIFVDGEIFSIQELNLEKTNTYEISKEEEKGHHLNDISMIYYSNLYRTLPRVLRSTGGTYMDISTFYLTDIYSTSQNSKFDSFQNQYVKYKSETMKNTLYMLGNTQLKFPIQIPHKIRIVVKGFDSNLISNKEEKSFVKKLEELRNHDNLFYDLLYENIIYRTFQNHDYEIYESTTKSDRNILLKLLKESKTLKELFEAMNRHQEFSNYPAVDEFIKLLDRLKNKNAEYALSLNKDDRVLLSIEDISEEFISSLFAITNIYENFFDIFEFSLGIDLSSGEENFLFQFANFYAVMNKELKDKSEITILIDEGETTFHPQWQKMYVKYMVNFFSENFSDKKFHLVFSSHSPFLLSDIPKQNIIFLDTYENGKCKVLKHNEVMNKKQTFGANIHTLLSDSFFMEGGLMGEFAKSKIEDVVKFLQEDNATTIKSHEEAKEIIDIVGEPVLQMRLEKMLDDYKLKNNIETEEDIQKQIEALHLKLEKKRNG